jgi:glycosyltransferase involved in cell wall biosynthesis
MVMRSLDVLLLTSHWEGLPRVILEALATGVPIVATRVGGVEEGIERDSCARLCAAGDIDGLTAGLEEILQRSAKGGRGASRVNPELPKEFHIEEMVKQYQSLYDRLLLERRHNLMPRSLGPASQP